MSNGCTPVPPVCLECPIIVSCEDTIILKPGQIRYCPNSEKYYYGNGNKCLNPDWGAGLQLNSNCTVQVKIKNGGGLTFSESGELMVCCSDIISNCGLVTQSQIAVIINQLYLYVSGLICSEPVGLGTAVTNFNSPPPSGCNKQYRNSETGELWEWDGTKWSVIANPKRYPRQDTTRDIDNSQVINNFSITATRKGTLLVYSGFVVAGLHINNSQSGALGIYTLLNGQLHNIGQYANFANSTPNIRLSETSIMDVEAGDVISLQCNHFPVGDGSPITNIGFSLAAIYAS